MQFVVFISIILFAFVIIYLLSKINWRRPDGGDDGGRRPTQPQTPPMPSPEVLLKQLDKRRQDRSPSYVHITDAREAVTVLLLEMAKYHGEVTNRHLAILRGVIENAFEFPTMQSEFLINHALWSVQADTGDAKLHKHAIRLVSQAYSQRHIVELDGLLVEMSEAEGLPNQEQLAFLNLFRKTTGVSA